MATVSVVVPTTNIFYLKHLLDSLSVQTVKPDEVIIVVKGTISTQVDDLCAKRLTTYTIIEQKSGFFTHALNIGKNSASSDIILFTDEDAITPASWVKNYLTLFQKYSSNVGCICSRDYYFDFNSKEPKSTPDDLLRVKIYRNIIQPILERPLPILCNYRFGVYLTRDFNIAHGPRIPSMPCFSLPFRGVNMGFRRIAIGNIDFPEHPLLKRAVGNEQYVGLKLILTGFDSIYVPNNPVLHAIRQSLSRHKDVNARNYEALLMKAMFKKVIADNI